MVALAALAALALVGPLALGRGPREARADEAPSADRLKAAAEEFDRGRRAYLAKDYEGAATHFENAYRDAPRAETLRLAIRARREAKQLARAATLAAIARDRYPSDGPTAQLAKEVLDEAGPALQIYDVDCRSECAVAADGRVVSQADGVRHRLFLDPGPHELGVSFKEGGAVTRKVDAKKGAMEALSFEAPPPPPVGPGPAAPGPSRETPPPPRPSPKPLGPVVFFVAAGVTVALGAATVVSGIDAQNNPGVDAVRQACAGKDESCPEYQDGKAAETRTNVLLGVTLGAAVVTGVIGVFFTEWSRTPSSVKVGAAPLPGGAALGASASF